MAEALPKTLPKRPAATSEYYDILDWLHQNHRRIPFRYTKTISRAKQNLSRDDWMWLVRRASYDFGFQIQAAAGRFDECLYLLSDIPSQLRRNYRSSEDFVATIPVQRERVFDNALTSGLPQQIHYGTSAPDESKFEPFGSIPDHLTTCFWTVRYRPERPPGLSIGNVLPCGLTGRSVWTVVPDDDITSYHLRSVADAAVLLTEYTTIDALEEDIDVLVFTDSFFADIQRERDYPSLELPHKILRLDLHEYPSVAWLNWKITETWRLHQSVTESEPTTDHSLPGDNND